NSMDPGLCLVVIREAEISGVEDRRIGSRECDSETARCNLGDEDLNPPLLEFPYPSTAVLHGRLPRECERCEPEFPGHFGDRFDFRAEPGKDDHLLAGVLQVLQDVPERLELRPADLPDSVAYGEE